MTWYANWQCGNYVLISALYWDYNPDCNVAVRLIYPKYFCELEDFLSL